MDCKSESATHYAGCECHEEHWRARLAAAEAEVRDLRGAMDADDERLRAASERVFGDFAFGCDTAMWLADEVMGLRQMLDVERAVREKAEERVAELEAELRLNAETLLQHNRDWSERCGIAEARVAELEEALSLICDTSERVADVAICEMKRLARRALEVQP